YYNGNAVVDDNAWHKVDIVREVGNGKLKIYVDGALDTDNTMADAGTIDGRGNGFVTGWGYWGAHQQDEIKLSTTARSGDWLATEYHNQSSPSTFYTISAASGGVASAQVQWLVTDQLGTPRMVIDQTGALANVKRHDYLPFGEELSAGTGGRTTT